uniref:DNA helicase n=1 Tax=Mesocestoides corti TaxID=53468 RepID=A0A5K3F6R8_MESCO
MVFGQNASNKKAYFWKRRGCRNQSAPTPNNAQEVTRTHSTLKSNKPPTVNTGPVILAKCPLSSPFPGWLLYFPATTYEPNIEVVKYVKAFIDFIKTECLSGRENGTPASSHVNWAAVEDRPVINIDYSSLKSSPILSKSIPGWPPEPDVEQLFDAKQLLLSLGLAVHTVATEKIYGYSENPFNRNMEVKLPYIAARVTDHYPSTSMWDLRAHHLGNLISIRATVARLGPIRPLCCRLTFRCALCDGEQVLVIEEDGCFASPKSCPEKGCRSKVFYPQFSSKSNLVIDTQTMLLQESGEAENSQDQLPNTGRIPRSITCFLDCDLVDSCVPGDFVHVCGVVNLLPAPTETSSFSSSGSRPPFNSAQEASNEKNNVFNLCLRVNSLTRIFSRSGEDGGTCGKVTQCLTTRLQNLHSNETAGADNSSEVVDLKTTDTNFSISDLYLIREVAEESNLFNLLIASVCPTICGRELVKMAILLALFGGSTSSWGVQARPSQKVREKSPDLSDSSEDDGDCKHADASTMEATQAVSGAPVGNVDSPVRRSSSHVLLVGDPGIGKSQLLRAAANVAPRAVYVCGNTASAAGLTVSTSRDHSGAGLEAGALVLADQGICCIDEFDKISCDPAVLLEVLEQQTVSVARGGYVCNLAACTSVLAAANPVSGHYDSSKTIYENVRVSRSLISRFDLIFILPDRPSENLDHRLSEHVLALHMGQRTKRSRQGNISDASAPSISLESLTESEADSSHDDLPLEARLRFRSGRRQPLSPYVLRKYIAYARAYVHPRMTPEAALIVREFYLKLRKCRGEQRDVFQVTIRQLESLIRLASARARAELREEISEQDARDVCDLMNETGYGTSQSGGAAGDASASFVPTKKRKNASATGTAATKRLLAALHREASLPGGSRSFTTQEIAGIAAKAGLSGDDSILYQRCVPGAPLSILIDNLNNIGALLKRGVDQYSLT